MVVWRWKRALVVMLDIAATAPTPQVLHISQNVYGRLTSDAKKVARNVCYPAIRMSARIRERHMFLTVHHRVTDGR